jgi:hypothetical protein
MTKILINMMKSKSTCFLHTMQLFLKVVIILFLFVGCNLKDFTNIPREDRIEIKIKAKKDHINNRCSDNSELVKKVNFEVKYPDNFDHQEHVYNDDYKYQFVDEKTLLLNLGRIKNIYSYILLDTLTNIGTFYFYTDRNSYDGPWWFKFGDLINFKPCKFNYVFDNSRIIFNVNLKIKRPLYKKDDLDMSDLIGYADFSIYGCSAAEQSDSTVDIIFFNEMEYLEKHKGAINHSDEYENKILKRLNLPLAPRLGNKK